MAFIIKEQSAIKNSNRAVAKATTRNPKTIPAVLTSMLVSMLASMLVSILVSILVPMRMAAVRMAAVRMAVAMPITIQAASLVIVVRWRRCVIIYSLATKLDNFLHGPGLIGMMLTGVVSTDVEGEHRWPPSNFHTRMCLVITLVLYLFIY